MTHTPHLATSAQLQRLHAYLKQKGDAGASGLELAVECRILNPATLVSHLRANGVPVDCQYERRSESGAKVYRYKLNGVV